MEVRARCGSQPGSVSATDDAGRIVSRSAFDEVAVLEAKRVRRDEEVEQRHASDDQERERERRPRARPSMRAHEVYLEGWAPPRELTAITNEGGLRSPSRAPMFVDTLASSRPGGSLERFLCSLGGPGDNSRKFPWRLPDEDHHLCPDRLPAFSRGLYDVDPDPDGWFRDTRRLQLR